MRIEDMPPVLHEWPEHTRLTEPEGDTVRVVDRPDPNFLRIEGEKRDREKSDDGARLDSYQARRLRTIDDIVEDIEEALKRAGKARAGADSVSRLELVIGKLDDMIASGHEARDLIAMFEEGR